ncbi:MAG: hypothetical protein AB7E79_06630 [Rhodospirillaceae bacterium]
MTAFRSRFLIAPEPAIRKFLVDMRLAAERSYRPWKQALEDGFAKTSLAPADRRELLKPHPLEDYFYAGLIGLQAAAVRECFTPTVAEALLRQVALQADAAAGRGDRIVSNMVFIIFGRIRKNAQLGLVVPPADVVTDVLLERLAIDRMKATRQLATDSTFRRTLTRHLTEREIWWNAFNEIYDVDARSHAQPRRTRAGTREYFLTRRTPASQLFDAYASRKAPPTPALSAIALKIGQWLTPRPHVH